MDGPVIRCNVYVYWHAGVFSSARLASPRGGILCDGNYYGDFAGYFNSRYSVELAGVYESTKLRSTGMFKEQKMRPRREKPTVPAWSDDELDSPFPAEVESAYFDEDLEAWVLSRHADVLAAFRA